MQSPAFLALEERTEPSVFEHTACTLRQAYSDETTTRMPALFRLLALALMLVLSACAGRHAHDTNSQHKTHTGSSLEIYGDVDVGVGSQRIR